MDAKSLKPILGWFLRLLLGGVFAYAAVGKLLDPAAFASDIVHYRLLPYPAVIAVALYLPWLELVCGIAVVVRWHERGALVMILFMCAMFTAALVSAWLRGLDITCGCFGHGTTTTVSWALVRSVGLGIVTVGSWFLNKGLNIER